MRASLVLKGRVLTIHLSPEELNEGLGEGLNPLVHDVVALLDGVLVVLERNILLLIPGCAETPGIHELVHAHGRPVWLGVIHGHMALCFKVTLPFSSSNSSKLSFDIV